MSYSQELYPNSDLVLEEAAYDPPAENWVNL